MIAKITGSFKCSDRELWEKIGKVKSLIHVSKPILFFKPGDGENLGCEWGEDRDYNLKLYLFGFIPLGRHTIRLELIDRENNIIKSSEKGTIAKVWNHRIYFRNDGGRLLYTDEIEIEAGLLTFFVWSFSHIFYRNRQRRWKKLLKPGMDI